MLSTALTPKVITSAVIVSRVYGRPVSGTILEIATILARLGVDVYLDENTAVGFNLTQLKTVSRQEMKHLDLIIVVGGDGSLLGAARTLVDLSLIHI